MARTKGITLKVRKAAEEASIDPTTTTAASTSEAQPQVDGSPDLAAEQPDEEMATAESSRGAASSRSRSARLSRTRSHEEAFGAESSSSRATPSRRSRRQPTKQEEQETDQDVEMGSLQQPSDHRAGEVDAEVDAASTPRSRSARSRIKSSTTPVPQTQVAAASRPTRSPRKAPRVSVVGRRGSGRSKGTPADEEEASEQPGDAAEQQEEDGADDDANIEDAEDGDGDEGEDDADEDADGDGDGDGDNDDEEGVDEEGRKTITVKGTKWRLEDDKEEVILPSDPEGDKKVDEKGRLQGGRTYKAYNFTSDERSDPEKVYMLAIDAARSAGYRDSLYFFRRNPQIFKIELTQGEKEKLIEDGRLSGQLRTRNVTMVPARNVYKLHGARFLSGGKAIVDDYYEAEARASGVKEGKTVGGMSMEEQEKRREAERERERPKKKADVFSYTTIDPQGDPVVTQFGDAGQAPWVRAGNWQSRKAALQRMDITEENWMLEMARSVRGMNTELNETRRDRLSAFPRFNRYVDVDDVVAPSDELKEEVADGEAEPEDDPEALNDLPPWERERLPVVSAEEQEEESEKRKTALQESLDAERRRGPPIGVYEPNTHLPHFSVLTQPTQAAFVKVAQRPAYIDDQAGARGDRRPILGGDKLGSGAWGVASISIECLPPARLPGYVAVSAGEEGTAPARMPSA
ncbi:Chromatin structure-remodeling complex subunit RSC7 [Pseudozyma hubeiensis]|nr:Chromatin structure-remodeling complex subunit RSC7 [Pseudozyma hubeiensis]